MSVMELETYQYIWNNVQPVVLFAQGLFVLYQGYGMCEEVRNIGHLDVLTLLEFQLLN
jgi:hypothetical protein